jgi:hypothetical protein
MGNDTSAAPAQNAPADQSAPAQTAPSGTPTPPASDSSGGNGNGWNTN